MSECKTYEQTLAHRVLSVGHVLQSCLLLMNFLIFCHVSFIAEIVKVASIGLGVKFWDERRALRAEGFPVYLSKVLMLVNILDGRESLRFGCNATGWVSKSKSFPMGSHT